MSAFGDGEQHKNDICDAIRSYIQFHVEKTSAEKTVEIMEAVVSGLRDLQYYETEKNR